CTGIAARTRSPLCTRLSIAPGFASSSAPAVRRCRCCASAPPPVRSPARSSTTRQVRAPWQWLGDRDLATTSTHVRLLGLLRHPLERYWVLRDAFVLETEPDGLLTLAGRIEACEQGDPHAVSDD